MKGEGMFHDRNMGKLPLHNKMGDYFPHQVDPNNPDIYYAGDVADGTAQNMEGAAPTQMGKAAAQQIFGKKKYKIESSRTTRTDEVEPLEVEFQSVGRKGGDVKGEIRPGKEKTDMKNLGISESHQEDILEHSKPIAASSKESLPQFNKTIYTKNKKSGLYTNKKWDLGLNYRKSTSGDEDTVTSSITKYNKKGEVKKVISSDDYSSRKYKRIQKKKERILDRARKGKRNLTPKERKADNLKIKQAEIQAAKDNKMFRM